ncbi:hypothetical protein CU669_17925 [Paramagnetospirillum kuznetsovii]|uniref:PRC-barrel domain-containing protein n=1 Tax=Paramagnetospirillum kuznetsovii TaxID=2053833 RepID=A0A364NTW7_9PROT|nr:hypothetical protein [Paramagnetospirillum kuznetsovii]RAU20523.1 hypothetical protein CU669_17925 [Paramagnetospirillum kuznetsovii]
MIRACITAALILMAADAVADDKPPGIRVVGSTIYTIDSRGHTTGTLREVSPGTWTHLDLRGVIIRTIQVPPGCQPLVPCRTR